MRFVPGTALLLSLATVQGRAQTRPDSVSLRFGWPTGTTARVDQEWIRVQRSPERQDSIGVRSRYRLRVLDHADGKLIVSDSFEIAGTSGLDATTAQGGQIQRLLTQLGSFQPSYVVSSEGEFRRLEKVEEMKQLVDSLLAPMLRDLKDLPPQAQALIRSATSEQALAASAAQEWNAIVGTWIGADWVVGESYGATIEEAVPIMAGLKIPMRYEFAAAERVPCTPGTRRAACVRLELRSEPDTAAFRQLTTQLVTQLGVSGADVVKNLQNMRATNEVTLIAEPRTLRPYSVARVRRVEVRVAPSATETGGTTTRVDVRTARYQYDERGQGAAGGARRPASGSH